MSYEGFGLTLAFNTSANLSTPPTSDPGFVMATSSFDEPVVAHRAPSVEEQEALILEQQRQAEMGITPGVAAFPSNFRIEATVEPDPHRAPPAPPPNVPMPTFEVEGVNPAAGNMAYVQKPGGEILTTGGGGGGGAPCQDANGAPLVGPLTSVQFGADCLKMGGIVYGNVCSAKGMKFVRDENGCVRPVGSAETGDPMAAAGGAAVPLVIGVGLLAMFLMR